MSAFTISVPFNRVPWDSNIPRVGFPLKTHACLLDVSYSDSCYLEGWLVKAS